MICLPTLLVGSIKWVFEFWCREADRWYREVSGINYERSRGGRLKCRQKMKQNDWIENLIQTYSKINTRGTSGFDKTCGPMTLHSFHPADLTNCWANRSTAHVSLRFCGTEVLLEWLECSHCRGNRVVCQGNIRWLEGIFVSKWCRGLEVILVENSHHQNLSVPEKWGRGLRVWGILGSPVCICNPLLFALSCRTKRRILPVFGMRAGK